MRINGVLPGYVMTSLVGRVQAELTGAGMKVDGFDGVKFPPAMPEEVRPCCVLFFSIISHISSLEFVSTSLHM